MIGDDCKHNGHPLQSNSADLTTGEEGNRGYCLDNDEG